MPDLLEVIAESDTSVLNGWAEVFTARVPRINRLPPRERQRELLAFAREFNRRATWAAETAEGWVSELKTWLREGINGHEFGILCSAGKPLCQACLMIVDFAGKLWTQIDAVGETVDVELNDARAHLAVARVRITKATTEFDSLASRVNRQPPVVDPTVIERGKEQIEQGKWLTPEQARAAVRKSE